MRGYTVLANAVISDKNFKTMNTVIIVLTVVVAIIGVALSMTNSRPYTTEEWEEQCRKDFKKHGSVPDECYKTNELCKYNCKGLCKESC